MPAWGVRMGVNLAPGMEWPPMDCSRCSNYSAELNMSRLSESNR